jgi:DNA processing protein
MNSDDKYFIAFNVFPGIGPVRFKLLYDYFGTAKAAYLAPEKELSLIHLNSKIIADLIRFREHFDIDDYVLKLNKLAIFAITWDSPHYPKLLKQIPDPPFVIYIRGKKSSMPINLNRTIAIVGTRKITSYGTEITQHLTSELVNSGFTIVSGMAYGVDAVAHQVTLDQGGQTIAVLGCGVDVIAPASNTNLYHEIIESGRGAVISEIPLGERPVKGLFPARNRIISGLSLGVVVTEGADDSGALITARYAGEQGREVFAVPGPINNPYSQGPFKLLKKGAKLVSDVNDILEELNISNSVSKKPADYAQLVNQFSGIEKQIVSLLINERLPIDEIGRKLNSDSSLISSTLTILEIRGIVKDYGGKVYGLT